VEGGGGEVVDEHHSATAELGDVAVASDRARRRPTMGRPLAVDNTDGNDKGMPNRRMSAPFCGLWSSGDARGGDDGVRGSQRRAVCLEALAWPRGRWLVA
jgi:hypothetical protein